MIFANSQCQWKLPKLQNILDPNPVLEDIHGIVHFVGLMWHGQCRVWSALENFLFELHVFFFCFFCNEEYCLSTLSYHLWFLQLSIWTSGWGSNPDIRLTKIDSKKKELHIIDNHQLQTSPVTKNVLITLNTYSSAL